MAACRCVFSETKHNRLYDCVYAVCVCVCVCVCLMCTYVCVCVCARSHRDLWRNRRLHSPSVVHRLQNETSLIGSSSSNLIRWNFLLEGGTLKWPIDTHAASMKKNSAPTIPSTLPLKTPRNVTRKISHCLHNDTEGGLKNRCRSFEQ